MAQAKLKTKKNKKSVAAFLNGVKNPIRKRDAKTMLAMMKAITKQKPTMWGSGIVGFGNYHYQYEATGREGDWFATGFSPRTQNTTIYIMPGYSFPAHKALLGKLGPHKLGKSCLYITDLQKVHLPTLRTLIARGYRYMQKKYKK
jgi:hypothetical protein